MKNREEIEDILKENIIFTEYIPTGLTNDNYHIKTATRELIVRVPKNGSSNIFNYPNELNIHKWLDMHSFTVPTLYFDPNTGVKITPYIPDTHTYSSKYIIRATNLIKNLHHLKLNTGVVFNILELYDAFSQTLEKKPLERDYLVETQNVINSSPTILCHNDLVAGNFLFSNFKDYLIDFEYAKDNHPFFDLMSFITENDIYSLTDRSKIYLSYFGRLPNTQETKLLERFEISHHILWSAWALSMYQKHQSSIYLDIYDLKQNRLKELKKNTSL